MTGKRFGVDQTRLPAETVFVDIADDGQMWMRSSGWWCAGRRRLDARGAGGTGVRGYVGEEMLEVLDV